MKKLLLLVIPVLFITACSKDKGNYSYHTINEVSFANFDSVNGYIAFFGDTFRIAPTIVSSQNQESDTAYTYEWSYRVSTVTSATADSVMSTARNLNVLINMPPGNYTLMYKVTDKKTGVQFHILTTLTVSTEVYEGFLVLSDVSSQSRLDMLSYNKGNNTFTRYTDVLKKMGSTAPMNGTPYQVLCMQYTTQGAQTYGIFLLNSAGTNRINQETFGWDPTYNIRYLMVGQVPADFTALRLTGSSTHGTAPLIYMYGADGNVYDYSTFAGYAFKYSPLNVYTVAGAPFKVSPYIATDGVSALMYNQDKKNFVNVASYTSTTVTDVDTSYHYPSGLDLQYMECIYYAEAGQNPNSYAVLRDPTAQKSYLLQFLLRQKQTYYKEITGTGIDQATCFAVSPDLGYLFYSVGGKLYEYDPSLQMSTQMADYGGAQISYLSFPHIATRYGKPNYITWTKSLLVGSYDPAGPAGGNGTLEQFSIPDVNRPLVKTNSWTGFGKIVSAGYRER